MKKVIFLLAFLTAQFFYAQKAQVYDVDIQLSFVEYLGKKPLGSHNGKIPIKKGFIKTQKGLITEGEFYLSMADVTCEDIKDKTQNNYFISHLKSEDFFEVKKYPTAKFIITGTKKISQYNYTINGNLTLKGITKKVSFPAFMEAEAGIIYLKTADYFYINRAKWGVKYKSKSFFNDLKDKFIEDKVGVKISVFASLHNNNK